MRQVVDKLGLVHIDVVFFSYSFERLQSERVSSAFHKFSLLQYEGKDKAFFLIIQTILQRFLFCKRKY